MQTGAWVKVSKQGLSRHSPSYETCESTRDLRLLLRTDILLRKPLKGGPRYPHTADTACVHRISVRVLPAFAISWAHYYKLSRNITISWAETETVLCVGTALAQVWSTKRAGAQRSGNRAGSSNGRVKLCKDILRVVRMGIGVYCPPTLHPEKPGSTSTPSLAFGQLAFLMTEQFWEILLLEHFNSRKKFLEAKAWQVVKAAVLVWKKLRKTLTCQVCADGLGGQQQQAGQGQASSIFPETSLMGVGPVISLRSWPEDLPPHIFHSSVMEMWVPLKTQGSSLILDFGTIPVDCPNREILQEPFLVHSPAWPWMSLWL